MEKIYSIKERIIYILLVIILSLLQLLLLINFSNNVKIIIVVYVCVVIVVALLIKLFDIPYHVVVNNNKMKVYDFPLLATNKFYHKKRSLILWNSEINIDEVQDIQLVKLTKEQKMRYIGYIHFFNRYIKVSLNNSSSDKYIYISPYSKSQINKIINLLNNK